MTTHCFTNLKMLPVCIITQKDQWNSFREKIDFNLEPNFYLGSRHDDALLKFVVMSYFSVQFSRGRSEDVKTAGSKSKIFWFCTFSSLQRAIMPNSLLSNIVINVKSA